ncbi:hypothetical protein HRR83_001385 [Exophiala dermatitidis]|uniref:Uncharacterized protein n=1 Tax=Exophiala dermatitidis TaxID=5970 RepID=A0AAN6F2B2_EXODE|nr:hypothetical protein HRR74_001389 [Exophiala dermatitidis]KAJ4526860.1 hypothetical protein HRR73_001657 [Exophiala dermatitidis]KAJ4532568.1 hypothetical protein HRR76_007559 [Exophiala dermatitidis]KAJ4546919.1 hypothetical protein HRR77_004458 [Exophiala dermatitidis]KAJ4573719.1 hypothetical protein HRR79_002732 [Exophiala dermatitidis]
MVLASALESQSPALRKSRKHTTPETSSSEKEWGSRRAAPVDCVLSFPFLGMMAAQKCGGPSWPQSKTIRCSGTWRSMSATFRLKRSFGLTERSALMAPHQIGYL